MIDPIFRNQSGHYLFIFHLISNRLYNFEIITKKGYFIKTTFSLLLVSGDFSKKSKKNQIAS